MKNTNIVLTVFLIASLLSVAIATATEVGDILGTDAVVSDATVVADSISSSDVTKTEFEIEDKIKFDSSSKQTVSKGQGWIVTEGKGALLEILFVSREGVNSDGVQTSISKGWLKAGDLKLKLDSTAITATKKTFNVIAGDGSVSGTLVLEKTSETYQTGFAVWNGNLDLKVKDRAFTAKTTLAIEEKQNVKPNNSGNTNTQRNAVGTLVLGDLNFNLEGKFENLKKFEFNVAGQNNMIGELELESSGANNYVGSIKIEEKGDEDDRMSGRVIVTLKREGNTLYGPITLDLDESSSAGAVTLEGTIKIALPDGYADKTSKESKFEDSSSDDSSDSNEDSDSSSENRGFWKKFFGFFGGK